MNDFELMVILNGVMILANLTVLLFNGLTIIKLVKNDD